MAQDLTVQQANPKSSWGGDTEPLKASYGKLMMWFFLVTDAFTFTGLLLAYLYFRYFKIGAENWLYTIKDGVKDITYPEEVFTHFPFMHGIELPLLYVGFMTFVLIMSSVTMVLAVDAGHRMDRKNVIKWMSWTVIGGAVFVGSQAWEWTTFIVGSEHGAIREMIDNQGVWVQESFFGANMRQNEYGHQLFANFFFFITGFHGFHVLLGVIINFTVLLNVVNNTYEKRGHYEMIEKVGLYWHFVDLVWVFVFTLFYLL